MYLAIELGGQCNTKESAAVDNKKAFLIKFFKSKTQVNKSTNRSDYAPREFATALPAPELHSWDRKSFRKPNLTRDRPLLGPRSVIVCLESQRVTLCYHLLRGI